MDFRILFQLREKRFWWMDVIFYFAVSLFIATIFCYVIFLVKNSMQREEIKNQIEALQTVGTPQQKEYEKSVLEYQKKINDFTEIFENHEFASHVFGFMQKQTLPNIWFKQFSLDKKNTKVEMSGEADSMDAVSRQVANFERNENVENVTTLSSSLGQSAKIDFSLSVALNKDLFAYVPELEIDSPKPIVIEPAEVVLNPQTKDRQKLITVFDFLLSPEVIGQVDQVSHTVIMDVPYGTDLTKLQTLIIISPGATITPKSGVIQNFTTPVFYTVTAKDGSTQEYVVKVNVLPEESVSKGFFKFNAIFVAIGLVLVMIVAVLASFFIFRKRLRDKQQDIKSNAN